MNPRERLEAHTEPLALAAQVAGVIGGRPIYWRRCCRCSWAGLAFQEDYCTNMLRAPDGGEVCCGGALVIDFGGAVPGEPVEPAAPIRERTLRHE